MARTTADVLVERLIDWGVTRIFGIPGDGINGVMEALRTRQDRIQFIQVRHEEAGAFMACAHAKFTGDLGVCLATSGPGAIHLLNGLYDARLDGAPVLAITGQTYHDLLGTHYQQEVDLVSLYKDVAVFNQMVTGARQMRALVDLGCRTALAQQGVAHINIPVDIQDQKLSEDEKSEPMVPGFTSGVWTPPICVPREEDMRRAASVLNQGGRTAILAGRELIDAFGEFKAIWDPDGKMNPGKIVAPRSIDDDRFEAESAVLKEIGLTFSQLASGCCGMAGSFGYEREKYAISIAAGERVLLPAVRAASPRTIILTDGFSCKSQIAQETDRHALHLAEVLKMALDKRSDGALEEYPEREMIAARARAQRRSMARAGLVLAALFGGVAALARALPGRRALRKTWPERALARLLSSVEG